MANGDCFSCNGTGGTYTGPCWDCRGTGHAQVAPKFSAGQVIHKPKGYIFPGHVLAVFLNRSGDWRVAAEDDRGMIHIFNESQLELGEDPDPERRKL